MKKSVKKEECCCGWICSWHRSSVNSILHIIAFLVLIFGLWNHSWKAITLAIVIAILGHLIQAINCRKSK